jgi:hypothetical protein
MVEGEEAPSGIFGFLRRGKKESKLAPRREENLPKFWHKKELREAVFALQEGRPVMVCGPWSSGKTVLAEAAATKIEPDESKHYYAYLVAGSERITREEIKDIKEKKPTIAVIDEVTTHTLNTLDRLIKGSKGNETNLVIIVNVGSVEEVEGDRVREDLLSLAEESDLEAARELLTDIEVITLPNPQWEEVRGESRDIIKKSIKYGSEFQSPGGILSKVRESEQLEKMLSQE